MSDICSECAPPPYCDINLDRIARRLKPGKEYHFICEDCTNRAIKKEDDGRVFIGKAQPGNLIEWVQYLSF